jgi:hypothetical protein
MNVADPGKPPVHSYSAYTGYLGWNHSRVLPAITVNLCSSTKEQERTKAGPLSFEESLARLDALLKGIRLRPTEPVMPELSAPGGLGEMTQFLASLRVGLTRQH